MQPIYVTWYDATCSDDWEEADDATPEASEMLCHTVGYLVEEVDGFVTIAHTTSAYGDYVRGTITIPASCIKHKAMLTWPGITSS